ncbi:cyclopropane-fatty-acyl-phospholipid synthase family protein [Paracoccus sp. (in: a-proteobacteria)]|uniref:SAM-dependent methyltransferase n=1 Tax=Paracoccus sp. TaxID=267 RepID=UPI0026E0F950|nr:class I SAM-dependent methyltransferase [Paracoccus sp. (in: a-proteobacteria)]MDO5647393.1 class I SAM-dependent methyltransferase [Paracoccus sp. (in: a-proteobacteria)]
MTRPADPDFSALTRDDLAHLILQRSQVLADVPQAGQVIRAWSNGDAAPLMAQVDRLGADVAARAFDGIAAEYEGLRDVLAELAPARIADIGCGYAFFDLLAWRNLGCDLVLIDTETNDHRYFGYAKQGAAYSNLTTAARFLKGNGVPDAALTVVNPDRHSLRDTGPVDLIVSFLACGFHWPAASYLDYFRTNLRPGGAILLDLRDRSAAQQLEELAPLGRIHTLPSPPKARRIFIKTSTETTAKRKPS